MRGLAGFNVFHTALEPAQVEVRFFAELQNERPLHG